MKAVVILFTIYKLYFTAIFFADGRKIPAIRAYYVESLKYLEGDSAEIWTI